MSDTPPPARRLIYKGKKIDLALQSVRMLDGTYHEREVVIHRGAVALIPMVDRNHVCLLRNERYSVGQTLIEVPAGTIDAGETPDSTAPRELSEETGYRAGKITRIAEWWVSPPSQWIGDRAPIGHPAVEGALPAFATPLGEAPPPDR